MLNLYLEAGLSVAEFCTCARRQHDACITNMNACIWRQRNRYCHRQILVHKHRDSRTSCSKAHAKKLHTDIRTHAKVHIHTHTLTHSHTHSRTQPPGMSEQDAFDEVDRGFRAEYEVYWTDPEVSKVGLSRP